MQAIELKISALLLITLSENRALSLLVRWTSLAMQINGSPLNFSVYPYEISKMKATNPKAYQEKGIELCAFWILSNFFFQSFQLEKYIISLSENWIKEWRRQEDLFPMENLPMQTQNWGERRLSISTQKLDIMIGEVTIDKFYLLFYKLFPLLWGRCLRWPSSLIDVKEVDVSLEMSCSLRSIC